MVELFTRMGRLEGRQEGIEHRLAQGDGFMRELRKDIGDIKELLATRKAEDAQRVGMVKGGWWVFGVIVGVVGVAINTVSYVIGKILTAH